MASHTYASNVTIIGDAEVGKTALATRYRTDELNSSYSPTSVLEFAQNEICLGADIIQLHTRDTPGQEQFRLQSPVHFIDVSAVILVYSVDSQESFKHIRLWSEEARTHCESTTSFVLVGNKIDTQRQVTTEEGQKLADELAMAFIEVTATNKEQVEALFLLVGRLMFERGQLQIRPKTPESCLVAKIIIVGDSIVGKSCLSYQFCKGLFVSKTHSTIGVEFATKVLNLEKGSVKLQIWNTSGNPIYRSITEAHYRRSIVGIIVYSVGLRDSFEHVRMWREGVWNRCDPNATFILVGNKIDEDRQVTTEEGQALADELRMPFIEVTAKNKELVEELFLLVGRVSLASIECRQINAEKEASGVQSL